MTKNEKISQSLKEHFKNNGHHKKGKKGWSQSKDQKKNLSEKIKAHYDRVGRVSEAHKKARNKANVYAWRARKRNAIPDDADLELIKIIYENCPEGYHVDHIIALASGGLHHQDNLQYLEISENCRKGKGSCYDKSKALEWQKFLT
jgi:uncharacterized Fe-S cluster protein YjdI